MVEREADRRKLNGCQEVSLQSVWSSERAESEDDTGSIHSSNDRFRKTDWRNTTCSTRYKMSSDTEQQVVIAIFVFIIRIVVAVCFRAYSHNVHMARKPPVIRCKQSMVFLSFGTNT